MIYVKHNEVTNEIIEALKADSNDSDALVCIYKDAGASDDPEVNMNTLILTSKPLDVHPFYIDTWLEIESFQKAYIEDKGLNMVGVMEIPKSMAKFSMWILDFRAIMVARNVRHIVFCLAELENTLVNEQMIKYAASTRDVELHTEYDYNEYVKEDIADGKAVWVGYLHNIRPNSRQNTLIKYLDCLTEQHGRFLAYMMRQDVPMSRQCFTAINESSSWDEMLMQLKMHCELNFIDNILIDAKEANKNKQFINAISKHFTLSGFEVRLVEEDGTYKVLVPSFKFNDFDNDEELPFN